MAFRRTDAVSVHSTKKVPTTIFTLLKEVITTKKISQFDEFLLNIEKGQK